MLLRDIQVLKTYGAAPYAAGLRRLEKQIKEKQTSVNEKIGMSMASFCSTSLLRMAYQILGVKVFWRMRHDL